MTDFPQYDGVLELQIFLRDNKSSELKHQDFIRFNLKQQIVKTYRGNKNGVKLLNAFSPKGGTTLSDQDSNHLLLPQAAADEEEGVDLEDQKEEPNEDGS